MGLGPALLQHDLILMTPAKTHFQIRSYSQVHRFRTWASFGEARLTLCIPQNDEGSCFTCSPSAWIHASGHLPWATPSAVLARTLVAPASVLPIISSCPCENSPGTLLGQAVVTRASAEASPPNRHVQDALRSPHPPGNPGSSSPSSSVSEILIYLLDDLIFFCAPPTPEKVKFHENRNNLGFAPHFTPSIWHGNWLSFCLF